MAPKFNALHASTKVAAVGGIGLVWLNYTVEAFKMAWHIISTSPEERPWKRNCTVNSVYNL